MATAAALLIALPACWYFGSPWWTLWRMREAARAGDWKTVASYADAGALEAQARAEAASWWRSVLAHPLRSDPEGKASWIARARQGLAELRTKPHFQLAELRPWLSNLPVRWAGLGGYSTREMEPYIVHQGLDAFEVRERGFSEESGPVLRFRRHGLGWRLTGVRWGQQ